MSQWSLWNSEIVAPDNADLAMYGTFGAILVAVVLVVMLVWAITGALCGLCAKLRDLLWYIPRVALSAYVIVFLWALMASDEAKTHVRNLSATVMQDLYAAALGVAQIAGPQRVYAVFMAYRGAFSR